MLAKKLFIIVTILLTGCSDPALPAGEPTDAATSLPTASRTPETESLPGTTRPGGPTLAPVVTREPPVAPSAVPTAELQREPVVISAADPRIRYIGRFDFTDPEHVYFYWSGAAIEAAPSQR
jgi:hypothetical protein